MNENTATPAEYSITPRLIVATPDCVVAEVPSASLAAASYLVTVAWRHPRDRRAMRSCTCRGFRVGGRCYHIDAVARLAAVVTRRAA